MSTLGWLVLFFFILLAISVFVYVLVIKAFYWGDKREPPAKK
jgi:NADH:ubiquinone oxidoreductase subunit 2 (subunit N)